MYWFLRWLIANDKFEQKDDNESCPNDADERKILSLAQDVIHCTSHGQKKLPKHISLAMSVRHLTGSKQIVTMLNSRGNCSSYDVLIGPPCLNKVDLDLDEIESVDSSLEQNLSRTK